MSVSYARTVPLLWLGLLLVGSCARSLQAPSRWFEECSRDADCDLGACVCGACTDACTGNDDCEGLPGGAACLLSGKPVVDYLCLDEPVAVAGVCIPSCTVTADCDPGAQCVDGTCLPTPLLNAALERGALSTPGDPDEGVPVDPAGGDGDGDRASEPPTGGASPDPGVMVDADGCIQGEDGIVIGNVDVIGPDAEQDLARLKGIHTLVGGLAIDDTDLTTLPHLECLETITDDLTIGTFTIWNGVQGTSKGNRRLRTLAGFSRLRHIGRHVSIRKTPLVSLTGLERLEHIGGGVEFDELPSLADTRGFNSLRFVGQDLTYRNLRVGELIGPPRLRDVRGVMRIVGTEAVLIGGFEGLEKLGGLIVRGNNRLERLAQLGVVAELDDLRLESNDRLIDLGGLRQVEQVGTLSLQGFDNVSPDMRGLAGLRRAAGLEVINNRAFVDVGAFVDLRISGGVLSVFNNASISQCDAVELAGRVGAMCDCWENLAPCR